MLCSQLAGSIPINIARAPTLKRKSEDINSPVKKPTNISTINNLQMHSPMTYETKTFKNILPKVSSSPVYLNHVASNYPLSKSLQKTDVLNFTDSSSETGNKHSDIPY